MRTVFALVLLLTVVPVCWADCEASGIDELIKTKPVVKVAPIYPKRALRKGVEGCVTLGYGLVERNAAKLGGLIASNIVVLGSTEPERRAFEKAAKRAISKWLFLARTHSPSDEVAYYSVIPFELRDSE